MRGKILGVLSALCISFFGSLCALGAQSQDFKSIEQLIQKGQYDQAITEIGKLKSNDSKDYAQWLKTLSLAKLNKISDAQASALSFLTTYPSSKWYHKVNFLLSELYIKQKNYKAAEKVYADEAARLLSEGRKTENADMYVKLAQALSYKPAPDELDFPKPDYAGAYKFYKEALNLELSPKQTETIRFAMAELQRNAKNWSLAADDYRTYLTAYDPDWPLDPLKARASKLGLKGEKIKEARLNLGESLLMQGRYVEARSVFEDLVAYLKTQGGANPNPQDKKFVRLSLRRIPYTYRIPNAQSDYELDAGVRAIDGFLASFPDDSMAPTLAWLKAQSYINRGRTDEAIVALKNVFDKKGFTLSPNESPEDKASREDLGVNQSPEEQFAIYQKDALARMGDLYMAQKKYSQAIKAYSDYISNFPNGPSWTVAQSGIVDAEYQLGLDKIVKKNYTEGEKLWNDFLNNHPLDSRAKRILYTLAQVQYLNAIELKKTDKAKSLVAFNSAIASFKRLVTKYPQTEESSLAQLMIGTIQEREILDFDGAMKSYKALTWGSMASEAQARLAKLTSKELNIRTERVYRTNETPVIKVSLRNIDKLKVSTYKINMESYFRKFHSLSGVESLDLALIQPDKTWDLDVKGYIKYLPIEQDIAIAGKGPGVYAVTISSTELESTTLLIQSDIDAVLKSSRKEFLVFVQDMVKNAGVSGARVLVTDGKKILLETKTGQDGALLKALPELATSNNLQAFIEYNGNIAATGLDLGGLSTSTGLAPRGYVYTERPAYKPGEKVSIKAIIRDVQNGSYAIPKGNYWVNVSDPQGKSVYKAELAMSEFGTILSEVNLSSKASFGQYSISISNKDQSRVFNGNFRVENYKLDKIKLDLDFARPVYFRGEKISATFKASYYFGQAVANHDFKYTSPDGVEHQARTDANGSFAIDFDSSPYLPGQALSFKATLTGENLSITKVVPLALQEFSLQVTSTRQTILANASQEFVLKTFDNSGQAVSKNIELSLIELVGQSPDPLLGLVPWLNDSSRQTITNTEVLVEKQTVKTGDNGQAKASFTVKKGGTYIVRARAKDRLENTIGAEISILVSDDNDETKLRFFANKSTYAVGASDTVLLHSRLKDPSLALICFEGEGIIKYQILPLSQVENKIPLTIGNEHFPNFTLTAIAMNKNKFYEASVGFEVERQLNIVVKPLSPNFKPSEKTPVQIMVTDQSGKPVSAEFSLALVNESLLKQFAFTNAPIVSFFQEGTRRLSPMRSVSTNQFTYEPITTAVNQDIVNEEQRVTIKEKDAKEAATGKVAREAEGARAEMYDDEMYLSNDAVAPAQAAKQANEVASKTVAKPDADQAARPENGNGGFWAGSIITDNAGKALVEVAMPQETSSFKFLARGVTKETLVGEASTSVLVRKDFFVSLKTPKILQEKDEVRFVAQVHNLTNYKGPANVSLTFIIDGKAQNAINLVVQIDALETKEVLFTSFVVPKSAHIEAQVAVDAGAENKDRVSVSLDVRPWGLPLGVHKTGTASDSVTIFTELPKDRSFESQAMRIFVTAANNEALVQRVLDKSDRPSIGYFETDFLSGPETRLHALLSLYAYLQNRDLRNDLATTKSNILTLISDLVSSQASDGSWSLEKRQEAIIITAQSYWSLVGANKLGFEVDPRTLQNAKNFLKNQFTNLSQDSNELKAIIQYALASSGDADYSFINRLYRERADLSEAGIVFTALTLGKLEKNDMALEMLALLAAKSKTTQIEGPNGNRNVGRYWTGSTNQAWLCNTTEATALALIAFETLGTQDSQIKEGIAYLEATENPWGYNPQKAAGYVTQAYTQYYGKTKMATEDYTLTILVNDQPVATLKVNANQGPQIDDSGIVIPQDLLKSGSNKVQFTYSGRGEYRYFVDFTGFTSNMKNPASFEYPSIETKKFVHEDMTYKGRVISKSTMKISELEMAQISEVQLNIKSGYADGYMVVEDYIPAGAVLIKDSIKGSFTSVVEGDSKLSFYFKPGEYVSSLSYQIASFVPGKYKVLPPIIRGVFASEDYVLGSEGDLKILAQGEKSSEAYQMNNAELYALGAAQFDDGQYKDALENLESLYARDAKSNQPQLARMLLWLRTETEFYNGDRVVSYFEILKEKFPELSIPFLKIMQVGKAYHDIGEFERSYLIYKAVVDSSFLKDVSLAGNLEKSGEVLGAIDYMSGLWSEYPNSPTVVNALFSLAQAVYGLAPQADSISSRVSKTSKLKASEKLSKVQLLDKSSSMLWQFATNYPDNELVDDAAFTQLNISLDKKDYTQVIEQSRLFQKTYAQSTFFSNFQYMEALAQFSLRKYPDAIAVAKKVAEGDSQNRELSTYILGQIYHSQKKPEEALAYYKEVEGEFADAAEAIKYFEDKRISMDEINLHTPGEKITLPIKYRNIKEVNLQVYKVDLMKLYLREKNLSKITQINLSGIAPSIEKTIALGNGKDYMDKETSVPLALTDEGAYLVVCRGDDLFTSGLVLISPLKIEVQEDEVSQRVRVNVFDTVKQIYPDNVHVKVVGSNNNQLKSGETDLRGIFIADGITGLTTVIARDSQNRYAFYRGTRWLGSSEEEDYGYDQKPVETLDFDTQYRGNDFATQQELNKVNLQNLKKLYTEKVDGVQVQQAK